MTGRETLHKLIEALPQGQVMPANCLLEARSLVADPVMRSLLTTPFNDEPDDDDLDAGLAEARRKVSESRLFAQVKREPGLPPSPDYA